MACPYHPKYEGVDHINIYSKSKLPLGRALSNFFHSVFIHPDYGTFHSIEGFYYYFLTGELYPELKEMYGYEAKKFGQSKEKVAKVDRKFKERIQKAITIKIIQNDYIQKLLVASTLPLVHYYYYGDILQEVKIYDLSKEHDYMVHAIEEIRFNLQKYGTIITSYNKSKRNSKGGQIYPNFKGI